MGSKPGAAELKKELRAELRKAKIFEIVDTPAQADATLTGSGELFVKGYYSLNPRAGILPRERQAVYGGSLSLELKDRQGETLWSYLATTKANEHNAARELARDAVKHLSTERSRRP